MYMYGLDDDDIFEMYHLKVTNELFAKQLSLVSNKIAPLGIKLNSLAPTGCRSVNYMMKLGLVSAAETLRYNTLCQHNLLTEAYRAEMLLKQLFEEWLPHIGYKINRNSILLKRCGGKKKCELVSRTRR